MGLKTSQQNAKHLRLLNKSHMLMFSVGLRHYAIPIFFYLSEHRNNMKMKNSDPETYIFYLFEYHNNNAFKSDANCFANQKTVMCNLNFGTTVGEFICMHTSCLKKKKIAVFIGD